MVANPPFSTKAWSNGFIPSEDEFHRFVYGIPPEKNGDYAFLLHILPHGVLFRGGAEGAICKKIIQRGYIKGIIGLPANLFYGTGIPACIIVLDKENAAARKGIFMIDASKGFIKEGNKNRLRAQDIHKIVDTFNKQTETAKYARLVPVAEIEGNDYNLNIPRYIDSTEAEDLQDIAAHLQGGIPNRDMDDLARYWEVFPGVRATLFAAADRPGYSQRKVAAADINSTIFGHAEFTIFNQSISALFAQWKAANTPRLTSITLSSHPKALIEILSESLLDTFKPAKLLDAYDVYQHLMHYWMETMQDDVYMLEQDGWKAVVDGKPNTDLIPPPLIVHRYFAVDAKAIEQYESERDAITRQMEELDEEHGGEDGLLAEAKNDKGKLTKVSAKIRLTAIKGDRDAIDERTLLNEYLALIEQEAAANKKVKDALKVLEAKVSAQYAKLSEVEIKTLVVDDKWLTTLANDVQTELDRVSQALTGRIKQLADRYATPLPRFTEEVQALAARVDEHLKKMGAVWN